MVILYSIYLYCELLLRNRIIELNSLRGNPTILGVGSSYTVPLLYTLYEGIYSEVKINKTTNNMLSSLRFCII